MSPAGRPGAASLGVIVTDVLGRRRRDPGVGAWLGRVAPRSVTGAMGLVLASDAVMRRLNRQFAGADHATDVLSFPAGEMHPGVGPRAPAVAGHSGWLGDVVVATGVSRRQAREAGHAWRTELRILALHGLLHILGYDHGRDGGEMARLERMLRRRGGLDHALIERARHHVAAGPAPSGAPAAGATSRTRSATSRPKTRQ